MPAIPTHGITERKLPMTTTGTDSRYVAAYLLSLCHERPRAQALKQAGVDVLARHEAGAIGIQPLLVGPHVAHGNVCQLPPAGKFLGKWELTGVALAGMRVYEGLSSEAFKQGLPGFYAQQPPAGRDRAVDCPQALSRRHGASCRLHGATPASCV